jgi:hypothetical protein
MDDQTLMIAEQIARAKGVALSTARVHMQRDLDFIEDSAVEFEHHKREVFLRELFERKLPLPLEEREAYLAHFRAGGVIALKPADVALIRDVPISQLRLERKLGTGPRFVMISSQSIIYPIDELEAFIRNPPQVEIRPAKPKPPQPRPPRPRVFTVTISDRDAAVVENLRALAGVTVDAATHSERRASIRGSREAFNAYHREDMRRRRALIRAKLKTMSRRKASVERFTDDFLVKLTVPSGRKDVVLFEHGSGLGVRKTVTGAISFLIQLRRPDGTRWRETLRPSFPGLSIAQARAAASARAGNIALGIEPFEKRTPTAPQSEGANRFTRRVREKGALLALERLGIADAVFKKED